LSNVLTGPHIPSQTVRMNRAQYRAKVAKDAIDLPRKSVEDLAELYGISVHSLLKYRLGDRSPNKANLAKISEGLRLFARQLLFLREEIDKVLREDG